MRALQFPTHPRIELRLLSFCPAGWRQKLHYVGFVIWVLAWTLYWRPRWVYASELLSCPIGLLLTFVPGISVIYHEHDSPAPTAGNAFMQTCFAARRHLAKRATMCILPNHERLERFVEETGQRQDAFCVWNCPRTEEVSPPRESVQTGELQIYYHGNLSPSLLPKTVIEALAQVPEGVRLYAVGYETSGYKGYAQQLKEEARRLGVDARVHFLDAMPRFRLLETCRRMDVGLALMPKNDPNINLRHLIGASNKPFDYLAGGLPLLVSDIAEWIELYVKPEYGLACDSENPESIAAALRWFLEHPAEIRSMGERGRLRIISEWNYEMQFDPVLEAMTCCHG